MTQITSIKVGLIAICIATVSLSLAQTPRTGNSRSNQTGAITPATAGHSGLSGNSTSAAQLGTNFRSSTITAPNTNAGAHIGINGGAQTGISNQTGGITGAAARGLGSSIGNSAGATDWDKCPDWHEYHGEHERRSTYCRRSCRACQCHY